MLPLLALSLCLAPDPCLAPAIAPERALGCELVHTQWGEVEHAALGAELVLLDDLDGDGVRELALTRRCAPCTELCVLSGATLEPLWTRREDELAGERSPSLALLDDLDGDGFRDLALAGEPARVQGAEARADPRPTRALRIALRSATSGELLGRVALAGDEVRSLTLLDDLDGDGGPEWAVGLSRALDPRAAGRTRHAPRLGQVALCAGWPRPLARAETRPDDGWPGGTGFSPPALALPSRASGVYQASPRYTLQAGALVLALEDVDGDGVRELACGDPDCRVRGARVGALSLFSGRTGELLWSVSGDGAQGERELGSALAVVGDHDGDGLADVAVGSKREGRGALRLVSAADGRALAHVLDGPDERLLGARPLSALGYLDGDGLPEIAVTRRSAASDAAGVEDACAELAERSPARLDVLSGRDLVVLARLEGRHALRLDAGAGEAERAGRCALLAVADPGAGRAGRAREGALRLYRVELP